LPTNRLHVLIPLLVAILVVLLGQSIFADPLHKVIDREIEKHAGGALSEQSGDAEFLRRIYLDLTGNIPTAAETQAFLQDKDPAKRAKLIDRLLASEAYPRRMAEFLSAMLLERRADTKVTDEEWTAFLQQAIAENKPWNELVGSLLFVEPAADKSKQPPEKFFLVTGRNDLHQKTQDVARLLLGRDIACAQCHDHPTVVDFTQADYWGLYTYLQETAAKGSAEFESVFIAGKKTTGPRLPGQEQLEIPTFEKSQAEEAKKHRPRMLLATNLPSQKTPLFVQNAVNRFWCFMMGRGLSHPLDMVHQHNPPSHPELMNELSTAFAVSNFNVKDLLREIALSRAYQRSGRFPNGVPEAEVAVDSYRTAISKPLTPEQMAWSVMQATGNLKAMLAAPTPEKSEFSYKNYINGRIDTPPDNFTDVMRLFVGVFGNPPGEPEVEFNPAVGHSLFLMNEKLVLGWLSPKPGNLVDRAAQITMPKEVVDELFLSVLTRYPTEEEAGVFLGYLEQAPGDKTEAISQLAWALLASAEFRANH